MASYAPSSTAIYRMEYSYGSEVFSDGSSYRKVTIKFQIHYSIFDNEDYSCINPARQTNRSWNSSIAGVTSSGTLGSFSAPSSGYVTVKTVSTNVWNPQGWGGGTSRSVALSFKTSLANNGGDVESINLSKTITLSFSSLGEKDTASINSPAFGNNYVITITHKTSGNKNTLEYTCGNSSGYCYVGTSGTTKFSKNTSTTGYLPGATVIALCSESKTSNTFTIKFKLTTYNKDGNSLGSTTYSKTVTIPSYSYANPTIPSPTKVTYSSIGAYVTDKTQLRIVMPTFPAAQYGATVTGTLAFTVGGTSVFNGAVTSGQTVTLPVPTTSGAATIKLTVTDGRPNTTAGVSNTISLTYIANPGITISNFVVYRLTQATSVNGDITVSWGSSISGNTFTCTIDPDNTFTQGWLTQYTVYRINAQNKVPEANSLTVTVTLTDALGNTATSKAIVPPNFSYMETTEDRVISLGKAASAGSNFIELGLETRTFAPIASRDASFRKYTVPRITVTSSAVQTVLSDILKALCSSYPGMTDISFETSWTGGGSSGRVDVYIANTNDTSGGLPKTSYGRAMYAGSGNYGHFGTDNYVLWSDVQGGIIQIPLTVLTTSGTAKATPDSYNRAYARQIGSTYEVFMQLSFVPKSGLTTGSWTDIFSFDPIYSPGAWDGPTRVFDGLIRRNAGTGGYMSIGVGTSSDKGRIYIYPISGYYDSSHSFKTSFSYIVGY